MRTLKLWTFQSLKSIAELKETGIIQANWNRYAPADPFIEAYKWMRDQLLKRQIDTTNHAPIWAWHSCGKEAQGPSLEDARNLLCDLALEEGIQIVEFECPAELALLSNYIEWNEILDIFMDSNNKAIIEPKQEQLLFDINRTEVGKKESIQASLPYLKLAWVLEIRSLALTPNDFNYNPNESV